MPAEGKIQFISPDFLFFNFPLFTYSRRTCLLMERTELILTLFYDLVLALVNEDARNINKHL